MIEESSPSDWREVGNSTLPGPLKDADGHTALEVAQSGADIPTLSKIVRFENKSFEKQDHLRYHYSRSLTIAAKSGDLDVVDRLIEAGDDLDLNASRPLYRIDSTAIEEAVKAGHYAVLQRLLKGERDITSAEGYFNMEALEVAVENEQHDEVERLRKNQKVLSIIKGAKDEALKLSCGQKDLRIVQALVEAGADPNSAAIFSNSDEYGISTAARSGYLDIVEYLIKNGAHVNLPNFGSVEKLTPLSAAAKGGYLEIIDILLKAGADIKDNALQEAAGGGHIAIVNRLLDAGFSPNQVKKCCYPPDMELRYIAEPTALQRAAMGGHSEIAELLLKAGVDVNVLLLPSGNGRTALQAAAENGSLDIVKMLLAAGADVNAPLVRGGVTALQAGVKSGNLEIVNLLLKNGAELDEDATSRETLPSLALAAEGGNLKLIKTLLHAMEISALFDEARITAHCIGALNEAAARGHEHVVRYFLEVGTPAQDGTYRQHFSLLASAVDSGNVEILKMLLKAKTNLKPKVSLEPAFHSAVCGDRLDMMELLLVARVNLNAFSGQLNSALIFASEKGNYALVWMLLSAASDIDAVDVDETALAKAIDRAKNEEVLEILREKQIQLTAVAENMIERTWEVVEKPLGICDGSLCSICAPKLFDIFVTPRCLDSMDFTLHPSLNSLQASVDAGCLFCTFFQKQFDYDEMPLLQGSSVPIYINIGVPGLLWSKVNTNIYRDYKRLGPITAAFNFITEPFEGKCIS
jgi:ankyrin repeat protein